MLKYRLAGVLGGMGPLATVDFLNKVVSFTAASRDQDHIPLIVHQVPQIADRGSAILEGSDAPFAPMLAGLQRLSAAGAEFALIACNSAHHWHERLARAQPLELLHIADAVSAELGLCGLSERPLPLTVLGTRGLQHSGIYRDRLGPNVLVRWPSESVQIQVDEAICAIKAGDRIRGRRLAREAAAEALSGGAEMLLLACTELPIALSDDPLFDACIDSTAALARLCIAHSRRVLSS